MGAWGTGIRQDDVVRDVLGFFEDRLKNGDSIAQGTRAALAEFAEVLKDVDEAPRVWIGIADAQWTYGELDRQVLDRVRADLRQGAGLAPWQEESDRALRKRVRVLQQFVAKLETPNPRPRKCPKRVVRAPKFAAGDCLAVALPDGRYAAALVLAADHARPEYGKNLIAVLDYLSDRKPHVEVFTERRWLRRPGDWQPEYAPQGPFDIAWYDAAGFRKEQHRFEIIGRIRLRASDPKDSSTFSPWRNLGLGAVETGLGRASRRVDLLTRRLTARWSGRAQESRVMDAPASRASERGPAWSLRRDRSIFRWRLALWTASSPPTCSTCSPRPRSASPWPRAIGSSPLRGCSAWRVSRRGPPRSPAF